MTGPSADLVEEILDGDLADADARALAARLAGDPAERVALLDELRWSALLRQRLGVDRTATVARIVARIAPVAGDARRRMITVSPRARVALAAGIACVALVGLLLGRGVGRGAAIAGVERWGADGEPTLAELRAGETVATGDGGARVSFDDGSRIVLGPRTVARWPSARRCELVAGGLTADMAHRGADATAEFSTPEATAIIVGTRLSVARGDDRTRVAVAQGLVRVRRPDGAQVDVHAGEAVIAARPSGEFRVVDESGQFSAWSASGPAATPPAGWTAVPGDAEPVPAGFSFAAADDGLLAVAARGSYASLSALLRSPRARRCALELGPLVSSGGAVIPASAVDLRVARPAAVAVDVERRRYRERPWLLERRTVIALEPERAAVVWLTVRIADDQPAGDYRGWMMAQADDGATARAPIALRVLPLRLPPAPLAVTADEPTPPDGERRRRELIDQREHGVTRADPPADAQVGSADVAAFAAHASQVRAVFGEAASARGIVGAPLGYRLLFDWDETRRWFVYRSDAAQRMPELIAAARTLRSAAEEAGLGDAALRVMDDPGSAPETFAPTLDAYRALKRALPAARTVCRVGGGQMEGLDELGMLAPWVDEFLLDHADAAIRARIAALGKPYGLSFGAAAADPALDRFRCGIWAWRSGARSLELGPYAARAAGLPQPLVGDRPFVYRGEDGVVPTVAWEAVRAGLEDQRWCDLLARAIACARAGGDADARARADAAAARLGRILAAVDAVREDVAADPPPTTPSAAILARWRRAIAEDAARLVARLSLERVLATPPDPAVAIAAAPVADDGWGAVGDELIADGGFERGASAFALSATAPGAHGGSDRTRAHSGATAFLLDARDVADPLAATVCVWGWGGGPPTPRLARGRSYEFSAWIRAESGAPRLRIELPSGSVAERHAWAEPPGGDGWQRSVLRVTMAADAQPTSLAVWLQGAGVAWCDDLSLREVRPPPLELIAEPDLVADGDREVRVRVRRAAEGGDAEVVVASPGGERRIVVPARGERVIALPVADWAPGVQRIVATGGGARASVDIERLPAAP